MRLFLFLLSGCMLLLSSQSLFAEEAATPPETWDAPPNWTMEDPQPPEGPPPEGPMFFDDADRMPFDRPELPMDGDFIPSRRNGPPHDRSPVRQWLNQLQQDQPEEYEKMKRMLAENPRQFHAILRNRVQQQRVRQALAAYPSLLEAYTTLDPQDQKVLVEILYQPPHQRDPQDRNSRKKHRKKLREQRNADNELTELDADTKELAAAYHTTEDIQAREQITSELRAKLEQLFDLRNQDRIDQIQKLETKISALKERMELRDSRRDQIVERRLEELTQDPGLKW
ncbi:MAG: hypothetical protein EOM20_04345 [Spartobacteria bacterium]|nr:hypothetical protein [Spartobacteria bacterium]